MSLGEGSPSLVESRRKDPAALRSGILLAGSALLLLLAGIWVPPLMNPFVRVALAVLGIYGLFQIVRGLGLNASGDRGPIKSPQDFIGGVALLAIALVAYFGMTKLGSMRGFSFGAGTVPRLFAFLLGALSVVIIISSFTNRGPRLERFPWRGPLFILTSVVFFGLTIRTLGLGVTGFITVMLSSAAMDDFRLKEAAIFAVAITTFCAFLFPIALGQPIPLWPTFLR